MTENKTISNKTIVQLLEKLGNNNPSKIQIELVDALLLRSSIEQSVLFDQKLTSRERYCLLLAAKGKTVQDTAELMGVKISTVRTWRHKILSKLSCRSMAQAIFKGIHYGYLHPTNTQ
jgi:DNA-binding NarL/FixJ family response regulator